MNREDTEGVPVHDRESKLRAKRARMPVHGQSLKRLLNERVAKSRKESLKRDWDWEQREYKESMYEDER